MSASDTVYAVTALLECPVVTATEDTDTSSSTATTLQDEWDMDCFHAAYDALGPPSDQQKHKLKMGIQFAMNLQKYILSTAVGLVHRGAITRLRHFRYAYITCTSQSAGDGSQILTSSNPQDQSSSSNNNNNNDHPYHVLAKPLALTRLANYLMDMHRANGKWVGENKIRPLVLLAEQPRKQTYLVVGYEMAETPGEIPKNKFGQHFEIVAQSLGANNNGTNNDNNADQNNNDQTKIARLESFDAHVVEVAASHVQRFLEQLHYIMDNI